MLSASKRDLQHSKRTSLFDKELLLSGNDGIFHDFKG